MSVKRVLVLGTAARGGILSVIKAYEAAGFYSPGRSLFVATHIEGNLFSRLAAAFKAYWLVAVQLLLRRVDLLHVHMSMRGSFWRKFIFLNMGRLANVPVIIHLHGSEFAVFYNGSSPWVQWVVRYLFNKADGIVVLSASWKDFVGTLTRNEVTIIGNFVPDRFDVARASRERNRHHILFLGKFGARKGIYDLLAAFVDVCKQIPDAMLFCGGNGEVDKVRAAVKTLGLENSVKVPGWISGDEKAALMHGCGIFVLPSYNEGLPMAIIEAMSFSMVVVSTTVGGIPELVDASNGALITPGDQAELASALVELLSSDDVVQMRKGSASRMRYEQAFSSHVCIEDMRVLYQSLGVVP